MRFVYILLIGIFITTTTNSAELKRTSLEVESVYSKHDTLLPEYTSSKMFKFPYQPTTQEQWSFNLKLRNDFILNKGIFGETLWLNTITGASTTKQFRYIGYEFKIVQQFTKGFGIFYRHHSEHGMDVFRARYPLEDVIGISICFGGLDCE